MHLYFNFFKYFCPAVFRTAIRRIFFPDPTPKIKGEETTYNTLFIGQTVFVFCEYEACDSPATITWYRVSTMMNFLYLGLWVVIRIFFTPANMKLLIMIVIT